MKQALLQISLILFRNIDANATMQINEQELLCSAVIQQYLTNYPTELWSEKAYIDRIIDRQCQVYVPWHKDWPSEYCAFYYIVDLADRKVLWKQDLSCNWSGY